MDINKYHISVPNGTCTKYFITKWKFEDLLMIGTRCFKFSTQALYNVGIVLSMMKQNSSFGEDFIIFKK